MCTSENPLDLVHQNVRRIISKIEKLQKLFTSDKIYLHKLCFSEYCMSWNDVPSVGIQKFVLVSSFSRSIFQKGGVCIYIHNDVCFNHLDFSNYCKEKILEIYAVQIETTDKQMIVMCV